MKCWIKDPNNRPNFEDLRQEISELLELSSESYGYLELGQRAYYKYAALRKPSATTKVENS